MNLKFWKKKEKKSELSQQINDEPRFHHYCLAHRAFPIIAHNNPIAFFGALLSDKKFEFIKSVIESLEEHNDSKEVVGFRSEDFKVHEFVVNKYPCVVVEFPVPERLAEVFSIAAVLKTELGADFEEGEVPEVDYYTLEKGIQMNGSVRTVLCTWSKDGSHGNLGDGPNAEPQSFYKRVCEYYKKQS